MDGRSILPLITSAPATATVDAAEAQVQVSSPIKLSTESPDKTIN
jgi:hypothetical protein